MTGSFKRKRQSKCMWNDRPQFLIVRPDSKSSRVWRLASLGVNMKSSRGWLPQIKSLSPKNGSDSLKEDGNCETSRMTESGMSRDASPRELVPDSFPARKKHWRSRKLVNSQQQWYILFLGTSTKLWWTGGPVRHLGTATLLEPINDRNRAVRKGIFYRTGTYLKELNNQK